MRCKWYFRNEIEYITSDISTYRLKSLNLHGTPKKVHQLWNYF